jgi:hypothetical protein
MIQISKTRTSVAFSTTELAALRTQFREQHCVRIANFLEPGLLWYLQREIIDEEFSPCTHHGIGTEVRLATTRIPAFLHFLVNSDVLFRAIEQITGCRRVGSFEGRVYRFRPGTGDHDGWHDDLDEARMIALSINLSTEAYSGGILKIREKHSTQILHETANTGPGDAILFRVAYHLEHLVTEVTGQFPKTAFAGWFKSQPDFLALLKAQAKPPR